MVAPVTSRNRGMSWCPPPAYAADGLGCAQPHHGQTDRIAGSCSFGLTLAAGHDCGQTKSQPGCD